MRSLSSKIKSVVELTGGVSRALQLSQRYGDSTSKMTVVSSKDGASEWVEFSEHFAYHLTSILCVLHKHGDEFRTISGDFVVELAFMLDAECDIAATITTEMRTFNNKELRASYDFKADGPNHNSARQHRKYRDVTVRSLCTILTFLSKLVALGFAHSSITTNDTQAEVSKHAFFEPRVVPGTSKVLH